MAEMQEMNMIQALNQALHLYFQKHDQAVMLGEDVGHFGGVFRVSDGLQQKYGEERVIDSPLNEGGIVGVALGMALGGLRPVAEIQFADFSFPAFDQIVNEVAKYRYRSGGQFHLPMVIRMPYGGGIRGGHYHSQSPESIYCHIPGLRVVIPSGPYEAKGLLLASLESEDPVIFLEPKRVYRSLKASVPLDYYTLPLHDSKIVEEGEDLTLVAYGAQLQEAKEAVLYAKSKGYSVELIDLMSLLPYDTETLCHSVQKTGRLMVVHEAPRTCGYAAELMAEVQEKVFDYLEAPMSRVTGFDTPYPYILENHYHPTVERIWETMNKTLLY